MASANIAAAACASLLPLLATGLAWVGLRLVIGFCFGGLSGVLEDWLLEQAGAEKAFAGRPCASASDTRLPSSPHCWHF